MIAGATIKSVAGRWEVRIYQRICPGKFISDERPTFARRSDAYDWLISEVERLENPSTEESDAA